MFGIRIQELIVNGLALDRPPPPTRLYHEYVAGLPRLDGKTVAVTGNTSGTGQALSRTCGRLGARIISLNRPSERAARALLALREEGIDAVGIDCDLQSFSSVRQAADEVVGSCPEGVDVLVNNAGVMALDDTATEDGCDVQMQTNHLSHFLLTSALWPVLRKAADLRGEARVVNQSSGARLGASLERRYLSRRGGRLGGDGWPGMGRWERYRQSKLANLLFTYALHDQIAKEAPEYAGRVKSICAHPGPTNSGLQHKTVEAGGLRLIDYYVLWSTLRAAQSVEDGTLGIARGTCEPHITSSAFLGPTREERIGPAVLLPPERNPGAERLLWEVSLQTSGVERYFAR